MPAKLHCIKGAEAGQVLVIPDGGSVVIGRSQAADISLDDKLLSRKHVRLSVREGAALIEDLGSSNGSYLNGERLTAEARLVASDRVKIGSHVFQVELSEGMVGAAGGAHGAGLPTQARPMAFCPVCYAAVATSELVERPGHGSVCPDCTEAERFPEDMIDGFRLIERLGQGRLGVVFKARHLTLQKHVAIKILCRDRAVSELALRRYVREAKVGGRLFHPNIVEMYDAAVSRGHYYIAMEFIEGETLLQRIGLYGALPVAEIVTYGRKIAEALACAHEHQVIHRAVTPGAIHLGAQGQVKLGDFGLAKLEVEGEERLTPPGEALGALHYMAPEQLEDASGVDHRADIYGLGASLYHALAGKPPFAADGVAAVLESRRSGALLPLMRARPDCPEPLAQVITHCLAQDRAHRYQSASELAAAFAALRG